jgi:hypothetical protein
MSFAVAAFAFAFTMDAHAATIAVSAVLNHVDFVASLASEHAGNALGALGLAGMAIGSVTSADTKLAKSKMFRVAVEGATTDGRTIERAWLEQIAANYSATKYGARVNLEHYRGIVPDGPFKAYGDVLAVEVRELDGEFSGKLGLYAQIEPTAELVALTKAKQKIYTSCEIDASFADSKQAYLIGLAVTDSPASLGTEILSFAAQNPKASPFTGRKVSPTNLFTEAAETVIEFEETPEPSTPTLFARVAEVLGLAKKKAATDDSRFADVAQAVETIAAHGHDQAEALSASTGRVTSLEKRFAELEAARERDRQAFDELHTQLSTTGAAPTRPAARGAGATVKTDC